MKKIKGEPIAEPQINTGGLSEQRIIDNANRLAKGYTEDYITYRQSGNQQKKVERQRLVQKDYALQLKDMGDPRYFGDGEKYKASILEKLMKGISQDASDPQQVNTRARSTEKKRRIAPTDVTGNQGIIGSMLNLGGSKLLGG